MPRYDSAAEISPFSQRRSDEYGAGFEPWSIETLVEAQRRECAGETYDQIADAMGLSPVDVAERLRPPEYRAQPRPERATVGYSQLKGR
jgi:hypothetical protein